MNSYRNRVDKRARQNLPRSEEVYLSATLASAKQAHAEATEDAEEQYRRTLPTYGLTAEQLGTQGLAKGGYAAYLATRARDTKNRRMDSAASSYLETLAEAKGSYRSYLQAYQKQQSSLSKTVTEELSARDNLTREDAYAYAVERGLSEDGALYAAARSTRTVRDRLYQSAADHITQGGLSRREAVAYALSVGLSEQDAARLALLGRDKTESAEEGTEETTTRGGDTLQDMSTAQLLDYLRRLAAEAQEKKNQTNKKGTHS